MLRECKISGFADEIDKSSEKQIALLKKLGQHYIEFRSADGKGVAEYTLEEAKALKERLAQENITLSSVGSPIGKINITDDFDTHFETYKHVVELAKVFGTKNIRMFSFYIPEDEDPEKYRDEVILRLRKMVDYAKEQDVILLHENEKGIYGDNAKRCVTLMEELYGDHFQCVFDFANFVQCKQDTWEAYGQLKKYVRYIHVKDALWEDGSVVPAGKGDGQLKTIFAELDAAGYTGYLSLEPHLANFAGLKDLEHNGMTHSMSDQEAAYELAFNSLQDLLNG